ncbi:MAG: IS256 family transposase [Phycisphaerales bacterium]|nr:MAG: IS256 family transposase [Phycisphaerales bacterium]
MTELKLVNDNSPVSSRDVLTEIMREGARKMLAVALEAEVEDYLQRYEEDRDGQGRRLAVRNGYLPERIIQTGLGSVEVRQPRVEDRGSDGDGQRRRFRSRILPPYLRKTKSIEEMIPWLYLKGVSTGDFSEALVALLGPEAKGLSASTVTRLKEMWAKDYHQWDRRSLQDKHYVYLWADGIHFNVRLQEDRTCILVVMGATADGKKELVVVQDGFRESEQSWRGILLDLKRRGLKMGPELAVGDGALGFWAALPKVFPKARAQRCWVHKTANVLNYLPKRIQPTAKKTLQEIWMAQTRQDAERAFAAFVETYQAKYPKAVYCLVKDKAELLAFYDFPAEHWVHIRTTNPIESTFATVRLRTYKTKGCGTRLATLTMVFKLAQSAARHWRKLNRSELLEDVRKGVRFVDGIREIAA